jgi:chromosome condensin MukBEF ATPase and DNA-binding subunit MukB
MEAAIKALEEENRLLKIQVLSAKTLRQQEEETHVREETVTPTIHPKNHANEVDDRAMSSHLLAAISTLTGTIGSLASRIDNLNMTSARQAQEQQQHPPQRKQWPRRHRSVSQRNWRQRKNDESYKDVYKPVTYEYHHISRWNFMAKQTETSMQAPTNIWRPWSMEKETAKIPEEKTAKIPEAIKIGQQHSTDDTGTELWEKSAMGCTEIDKDPLVHTSDDTIPPPFLWQKSLSWGRNPPHCS